MSPNPSNNPSIPLSASMHCPCGAEFRSWLDHAKDVQTGDPFAVLLCPRCGLGRTFPVPEDLGRYYGPFYHRTRHGFTDRFCLRRRMRFLELSGVPKGKLLDVGCGDGAFLKAVRPKGWQAAGIEMDSMAETLQREGVSVWTNLSSIPKETRFQVVTLWHSLEHMEDPVKLLMELRALIALDGALLMAVPDRGGFQAKLFRSDWLHLDVPRHLWHFDNKALNYHLERAGYSIQWWVHQELEFDVFGWLQSFLNWTGAEPNALFKALTGKPRRTGLLGLFWQSAIAAILFPVALVLTCISTLCRRGGTLVVCAKPLPRTITPSD